MDKVQFKIEQILNTHWKNLLVLFGWKVATVLNKPNPENFTAHWFCSSSATAFSDAGTSIINLKQYGGWKSNSVAEIYICQSKKLKTDTA